MPEKCICIKVYEFGLNSFIALKLIFTAENYLSSFNITIILFLDFIMTKV